MATAIKMPQPGNTVEECILTGWTASKGGRVSSGDIIAEIETDQAIAFLREAGCHYVLSVHSGDLHAEPSDGSPAYDGKAFGVTVESVMGTETVMVPVQQDQDGRIQGFGEPMVFEGVMTGFMQNLLSPAGRA